MILRLATTVPGIVCVVGALAYGLAAGKAQELGRIAFFCGLLALLFNLR